VKTIPRTLLVVDDDTLFSMSIRDALTGDDLEVITATTGAEALRICRDRKINVIILDQRLPDASGPDLCPAFLEANERTKIVFVTAYPGFQNALAAIRAGAFDYLSKPCELEALRIAVQRCLKTLTLEQAESVKDYRKTLEAAEVVLVGEDQGLSEVNRLIELAASVDSPILLTGETGTGKSFVAKAIHFRGPRRRGEFVGINCAALPESLIEAELFGYERGAFTGAVGSREGLFEIAEGGTLFLDEICEMPVSLQTRLLSVLDDRTIRRVGGRSSRMVDFRLVSATNMDPDEAVRTKRLREDLYYRLNVIRVHLPPLRQRRADIPALAAHFLSQLSGLSSDLSLSPEEQARLMGYEWPGNLRELRNVLERAILLHHEGPLMPSALLRDTGAHNGPGDRQSSPDRSPADILPLTEVEQRHIAAAVAAHGGNLTRAARALGISLSTLKRKIRHTDSPPGRD
jgi:two-component system, NtrC family, response regulator AtoC